jgi:hypothetical protein
MQRRLKAIIADFGCNPRSPDYLRLRSADIIEGKPKRRLGTPPPLFTAILLAGRRARSSVARALIRRDPLVGALSDFFESLGKHCQILYG